MKRINSIDTTRGFVMVIMALDHVRDFMHTTSMTQSPTNLQTTTTLIFMTRWVTHLCAPTFVFLSGVSAYILFKRSENFSESRAFLLKRGLWLVILEYPISLLFTLLFLGIMFLILFISEKIKNRFTEILSVYGRVPLFYFIIHLFIIHSLMFLMLRFQGFTGKDLLFGAFNNGRPKAGGGVDLSLIYLIWLSVVVLLYPVCKWYGNYKSEHSYIKILRYL